MSNTFLYAIISLFIIVMGLVLVIRQFPERRYRFKGVLLLEVLLLIFICLFETWDATHAYIQTIQIIFYSFINAAIITVFFVCRYVNALVIQLFFNISFAILKVPMLTLRGVLENKNMRLCNVILNRIFIENIWCLVIIIILLIVYKKREKQIDFFIKKLLNKNKIILFIVIIIENCLLCKMMKLGNENFNIKDLYLNLCVVFCIVLIILGEGIYLIYRKTVEGQEELLIRQKMLENEQNTIKKYYEEDAQRLHDMKHVLLYLRSCMNEQDWCKAKKCLEQQLDDLERLENRVWTGQAEIDFMLNHEHQKMEQKGIGFKVETEIYEVPIQCADFMIILGNLLDNAIEATEKCDLNSRLISLSMKSVNNMFIMELTNPYREEPVKRGKRLLSIKEEKQRHGWGLENVRQLVEKYSGDIQIEYEFGRFRVNILFYVG